MSCHSKLLMEPSVVFKTSFKQSFEWFLMMIVSRSFKLSYIFQYQFNSKWTTIICVYCLLLSPIVENDLSKIVWTELELLGFIGQSWPGVWWSLQSYKNCPNLVNDLRLLHNNVYFIQQLCVSCKQQLWCQNTQHNNISMIHLVKEQFADYCCVGFRFESHRT